MHTVKHCICSKQIKAVCSDTVKYCKLFQNLALALRVPLFLLNYLFTEIVTNPQPNEAVEKKKQIDKSYLKKQAKLARAAAVSCSVVLCLCSACLNKTKITTFHDE